MSSLDYLDLCRLCLVKDRVSVPIFEGEGDVRQIFLKIAACLPVKVGREDKLPKKICDDCVYKVELFYQFWNTTANAEKQLLQWLGEVSLDEKQGYVTGAHNPVNDHTNTMGMGMGMLDGMGMPMMLPNSGQQQMTSVPMDTGGNAVQPGPSAQSHDQQKSTTNQDDEEDESEEEDNSDDECDGDDGLPVKEESEDDPSSSRTIEPTTFVNVSLACDEAGPSGLQQQKINEMPEMVMTSTDGDPKSGRHQAKKRGRRKQSVPARKVKKSEEAWETSSVELKQEEEEEEEEEPEPESPSVEKVSDLKSVRTKRRTAMRKVDPKNPDKSIPPKKRKFTRKDDGSAALKKMIEYENGGETESNSSSHEEWFDSDLEKKAKSKKTKIRRPRLPKQDFYECEICQKKFTVPRSYRRHVANHYNTEVYECEACDKKFSALRSYRRHVENHKNSRFYDCPSCEKRFKSSSNLKSHIIHIHDENPPLYNCTICDYATKTPYCLQDHIARKHTEDYKFKCSVCDKNYKSERDYKSHMNSHDDGPQICDICGISYPSKLALYSHRYYKHMAKLKPFECSVCKQRLSSEKNLKAHMLQHNQEYVCELCGMKFTSKVRLSTHRKSHAEKSFSCTVCGRAFASLATQRVHMVTHSQVKPYACDICGSSYTQRSSLMLHWRTKHPEATEPPPPVTLLNIGDFLKPTNPEQG